MLICSPMPSPLLCYINVGVDIINYVITLFEAVPPLIDNINSILSNIIRMAKARRRSKQVNVAIPENMFDALEVLQKQLNLGGIPETIRYLLSDAINDKMDAMGLKSRRK